MRIHFKKRIFGRFFVFYVATLLVIDVLILSQNYVKPLLVKAEATLQAKQAQEEAKKLADNCSQKKIDWKRCYMDFFAEFTENHSVDISFLTLKALENVDSKTRNCHLMGHAIATAEIKKNPKSWKEFLKKIDSYYCTGGFIHGVVEGLSRYDPNFNLNEQTLPEICEIVKVSVKGDGADQYCAHITGHILLVEKLGNVADAIKICDNVPFQIQYQCYGGIFMESITRDNLVVHGISEHRPTNLETTNEQEKLCKQYTGLTATGCWREISHMYITIANFDPQEVYRFCKRASVRKDGLECYLHGVGLLVRIPNVSLATRKSACDPVGTDSEAYRRCISEVVNAFLSSSPGFEQEARDFCNGVREYYKISCVDTLNRRLKAGTARHED